MSQPRGPRPPSPNWGGLSRNPALWVMVALMALVLYQVVDRQRATYQEFSYSEFSRQLEAGNVARVEVVDGKLVRGDFRVAVQREGGNVKSFSVLLPIANSEAILQRLEGSVPAISAREPRGGLIFFLGQALPWIVIVGLWFFFAGQPRDTKPIFMGIRDSGFGTRDSGFEGPVSPLWPCPLSLGPCP